MEKVNKKIFKTTIKAISIWLLLFPFFIFSQKNNILEKPTVDERVELLSIVFRLADADEYSSKNFKLYTDKIENYFNKYKNHELIKFIEKIREENGIGYDAVMNMAVYIDKAPKFKELVPFSSKFPDERFGKENAIKFLALLKKFYKDANCKAFFKENESLFNEALNKFAPIYESLDLNWYKSFYGKEPNEKYELIYALGNGGNNYGATIELKNKEKKVYAIIGTSSTIDSLGIPTVDKTKKFPILLHEFNHSFVNYLTTDNISKLEKSGTIIYAAVKEQMQNQAYGDWNTMISESIVRAAVIKYMIDHNFNKEDIEKERQDQLDRGFVWIDDLVSELENYDKQRDKYPTLEKYMPQLIVAFDNYAENISNLIEKDDQTRPKIISISEFKNNDNLVNADIKTITINFDMPLNGKGYSILRTKKGKEYYPKINEVNFSEDKKSVILQVSLEKNKEYEFIMSGMGFKTKDNIGIKDYKINFKTKE